MIEFSLCRQHEDEFGRSDRPGIFHTKDRFIVARTGEANSGKQKEVGKRETRTRLNVIKTRRNPGLRFDSRLRPLCQANKVCSHVQL
jgi:hypothetical protein